MQSNIHITIANKINITQILIVIKHYTVELLGYWIEWFMLTNQGHRACIILDWVRFCKYHEGSFSSKQIIKS